MAYLDEEDTVIMTTEPGETEGQKEPEGSARTAEEEASVGRLLELQKQTKLVREQTKNQREGIDAKALKVCNTIDAHFDEMVKALESRKEELKKEVRITLRQSEELNKFEEGLVKSINLQNEFLHNPNYQDEKGVNLREKMAQTIETEFMKENAEMTKSLQEPGMDMSELEFKWNNKNHQDMMNLIKRHGKIAYEQDEKMPVSEKQNPQSVVITTNENNQTNDCDNNNNNELSKPTFLFQFDNFCHHKEILVSEICTTNGKKTQRIQSTYTGVFGCWSSLCVSNSGVYVYGKLLGQEKSTSFQKKKECFQLQCNLECDGHIRNIGVVTRNTCVNNKYCWSITAPWVGVSYFLSQSGDICSYNVSDDYKVKNHRKNAKGWGSGDVISVVIDKAECTIDFFVNHTHMGKIDGISQSISYYPALHFCLKKGHCDIQIVPPE
ncbi:hypothetical protein RFI_00073 [Reticulomyxa filosa]|uniref:B30.2/SPRY domain-containing protein n=1 Tax=Reticulomyxa filosa TaxID=46433 RepID=X6PES1_RETFI|nr:hypothetical protein RFI_00073 [Reticulomyxa filosa]|eukprot:ETO36985.1 hypothetical protein RFI_00073 [Reticulomyxa filosa]